MSSAPRSWLDTFAVPNVSGTAPVVVSSGVISVAAATENAAGTMSATDKTRLDDLNDRVGRAPAMISPRAFAPTAFRSHFQALGALDDAPYLISDAYGTLGAAQAAFPRATAAGYLDNAAYSTNSFDWAVLQEAVCYVEDYADEGIHQTLWLDHGTFGIIGTLTCRGGVKIKGQGAQGSNNALGTNFVVFADGGGCIQWLGDSPGPTGGGFSGTGGGLSSCGIWRAGGSARGGTTYTGGTAILIQAQDANHRPGEMILDNVLIAAEGTSTWLRGLEVDGVGATALGASGVRSVNLYKFRATCCTDDQKYVYLKQVTHFFAHHLEVDTGTGDAAGMTIEGYCNDVFIVNAEINGGVVVTDRDAIGVTGATNVNPIVVTTATAHNLATGMAPKISGVLGNTNANGTRPITRLSANTFSIDGIAGSGAYTSGGSVTASPHDINLHGRFDLLDILSVGASGTATCSSGLTPEYGRTAVSFQNKSSAFMIRGPAAPSFVLERQSETGNVTGDGTVYTVAFDALGRDANFDFNGYSPDYTAYVCVAAGMYKFSGHVLLHGIDTNAHDRITLSLDVNGTVPLATVLAGPLPANGPGGFQSVGIESIPVALEYGDVVRLKVEVDGSGSKDVKVYGDVGSRHSTFSGWLV